MSNIADPRFAPFLAKMKAENLSDAAIAAFAHSYFELVSGSSGMIPESSLSPVSSLPDLENDIQGKVPRNPLLLEKTVVLKLNGGLGTSMGLDKAKSLLEVKGGNTFLDLTAKQVISMRKAFKVNVNFMLMNSFNTSKDTLNYLSKYPTLVDDPKLELLQNKVPKVDKKTLAPAEWSTNPHLEWCPPGHGDLYTALYGSGKLGELLAEGVIYMFVSNSDNLGATLDIDLLTYFAESNVPFLMECCQRTEADKKGGHLALRSADNQLILRESAQCSKADEPKFQDTSLHQYFNTNNLWVRLDLLKVLMEAKGGFVPLPTIFNSKTVDPQQDSSTAVFQLETAMGAAIECFAGAGAVRVPRSRFAPVKKCSDLLLLRSDAYIVDASSVLVLSPKCNGVAPIVDLDDKKYKMVQNLEAATQGGYPSLVNCKKVSIKGEVWLSARNVFKGEVSVVNTSSEPKVLAAGVYDNAKLDLTDAVGLGPLRPSTLATTPYKDQKPGTSGLRKKTKVFTENQFYLHNFVQSTFNALVSTGTDLSDGSLLIGGDGRYYNDVAIQQIIKIAVANGVKQIVIGQNGLLSTPAVSAIIREKGPNWQKSFGAFILTASHNPGGPEEDFGIKYNCENGGPAPEKLTDAIYEVTKVITSIKVCESFPEIDSSVLGSRVVSSADGFFHVFVNVISSTDDHVGLLKTIFDFNAIGNLIKRADFSFRYDCMHGVQGPYAHKVFVEELNAHPSSLINAIPKDDFNGGHADPNLTYARDICDILGIDKTGAPLPTATTPPCFGAAADGDADRNMILGRNFFVTPSDSLAILAAHANLIPFFALQGGLKSVARSMPTSGAVDLVAQRLNLNLFETPTGWKYFGNVMDSKVLFNGQNFNPVICGEESFGTGSNHVREKDGLWAVLAWLSILAHYNSDATKPFVHVEEIVKNHWLSYGRNFYCRYDYDGVAVVAANQVFTHLRQQFSILPGKTFDEFEVATADEFTYLDPIDFSVSYNQGIRILFTDGSRIVFRLSGTAGSGATVRLYLEKYEADALKIYGTTADALGTLVQIALSVSDLVAITGFANPSVIT
jgi:phosphoglucomutase